MLKKLSKLVLVLTVVAALALTIFWFSRPADLGVRRVSCKCSQFSLQPLC